MEKHSAKGVIAPTASMGNAKVEGKSRRQIMSEHTAGLWIFYKDKLRPQLSDKVVIEVQDSHHRAIVPWTGFDCADQPQEEKEANARFIVLACNHHDELVRELQNILKADYRKWDNGHDTAEEFVLWAKNRCRALLSKIEGEK